MSQQGYAGGRHNPRVMIAIVGGHAAVLAAVMLIKMDLPIPFKDDPTVIITIPQDKPPPDVPPPPPEPSPRPQPRVDQRVDIPIPSVPVPVPGPTLAPPTEPFVFTTAPPGNKTVIAPPVPPMPDPPAPPPAPPRVTPVALSPRGNPSTWVTNDDYPSSALTREEQGRTRFVVTADASGRPTDCTVTDSSGSSALDRAACRLLMQRARFRPGTNADGAAVGGSWSSSFRWQIPAD